MVGISDENRIKILRVETVALVIEKQLGKTLLYKKYYLYFK